MHIRPYRPSFAPQGALRLPVQTCKFVSPEVEPLRPHQRRSDACTPFEQNPSDAEKCILFCLSKLARRGFELSEIRNTAFRHLRKLRNRQDVKSLSRTGTKGNDVFRMPLIHSSTSNAKCVTRALARHRQLINRLGITGICWRIQRPRFLALYAHNYRVGR